MKIKQENLRDNSTRELTYSANTPNTVNGVLQGKKLWNDGGTLMWGTGAVGGQTGNAFTTITVSGSSDIVADSSTDQLTIEADKGFIITNNASQDKITFEGQLIIRKSTIFQIKEGKYKYLN